MKIGMQTRKEQENIRAGSGRRGEEQQGGGLWRIKEEMVLTFSSSGPRLSLTLAQVDVKCCNNKRKEAKRPAEKVDKCILVDIRGQNLGTKKKLKLTHSDMSHSHTPTDTHILPAT